MLKKRVIPTIFATSKEVFEEKLRKVIYANDVHIDFMDGEFVNNTSVSFEEMESIKATPSINFQIHLMAKNPQKYINQILQYGIKTVLIHYHAFTSKEELRSAIDDFKRHHIKVYLVINPQVDPMVIVNASTYIDGAMIMSVVPGAEGQKFIETTYKKLEFLRSKLPNMDLLVDGGISDSNIRKVFRCGASGVCVGSYVTSSEHPKDNYDKLLYLIR